MTLKLLTLVETQQFDRTMHRTVQPREFLEQSIWDILSLLGERICEGEANVKCYVFLSMMLAQVEALEEGVVVSQTKVAERGRDSFQFCHDLLCTQASDMSLVYPSDTDLTSMCLEDDIGLDFEFLVLYAND
ncbi:hypothetical protein B0T10DRAFT_555675 [Thelonectria olida]|uniref:Uncharacterized protein n=1 Tax=Thelonectria olida TaxID=1576542 RepID=A0A9P9AW54_9HYPO|nr:hypothetical protein B0T10DRAFT_555675 [Thelonectria olida]